MTTLQKDGAHSGRYRRVRPKYPCDPCKALDELWVVGCPSCRKNNRRVYQAKNRDRLLAANKANYARTKDHQLRVQRERRAKNPEIYRERVGKWVKANLERMAELNRRWKAENRDRVCAYSQKRRSLKAQADGRVTAEDLSRIMLMQGSRCAACMVSIAEKYHADHIVPLAGGGSNHPWNIQLLCPTCNLRKGAKVPEEFMQSLGFLL